MGSSGKGRISDRYADGTVAARRAAVACRRHRPIQPHIQTYIAFIIGSGRTLPGQGGRIGQQGRQVQTALPAWGWRNCCRNRSSSAAAQHEDILSLIQGLPVSWRKAVRLRPPHLVKRHLPHWPVTTGREISTQLQSVVATLLLEVTGCEQRGGGFSLGRMCRWGSGRYAGRVYFNLPHESDRRWAALFRAPHRLQSACRNMSKVAQVSVGFGNARTFTANSNSSASALRRAGEKKLKNSRRLHFRLRAFSQTAFAMPSGNVGRRIWRQRTNVFAAAIGVYALYRRGKACCCCAVSAARQRPVRNPAEQVARRRGTQRRRSRLMHRENAPRAAGGRSGVETGMWTDAVWCQHT